jgi:hypothetical protein
MIDKETGKAAPKKKIPAKKKAETALTKSEAKPAKAITSPKKPKESTHLKIYEDPEFLKPAKTTERDLVKILPRNPFQAFVFWKIHPDHFNHVLKEFSANDPGEIQLKLKLEYVNQNGKPDHTWYDLAPMTNSYFCNFSSPVRQMRAYLYANHFGKLKLFLETGDGDLPPGVESFSLDGSWIHPKWIEQGWVKQDKKGDWSFTDSFDPEGHGSLDPAFFSASFDGSSRPGSQSYAKEKK